MHCRLLHSYKDQVDKGLQNEYSKDTYTSTHRSFYNSLEVRIPSLIPRPQRPAFSLVLFVLQATKAGHGGLGTRLQNTYPYKKGLRGHFLL